MPTAWKNRAGWCNTFTQNPMIECTGLDTNRPASPVSKATLCIKQGLVNIMLEVKKLPKASPEYKHFAPALGGKWDMVVSRCQVIKYTACREGDCAVNKNVKCLEVCKYVGPGPAKHKDCSKALCNGLWRTTSSGVKVPFGALACQNAAMMT